MANYKFFYLYLIGGLCSVGMIIYDLSVSVNGSKSYEIFGDVILALLLLYLANKAYNEKKNKEMM